MSPLTNGVSSYDRVAAASLGAQGPIDREELLGLDCQCSSCGVVVKLTKHRVCEVPGEECLFRVADRASASAMIVRDKWDNMQINSGNNWQVWPMLIVQTLRYFRWIDYWLLMNDDRSWRRLRKRRRNRKSAPLRQGLALSFSQPLFEQLGHILFSTQHVS